MKAETDEVNGGNEEESEVGSRNIRRNEEHGEGQRIVEEGHVISVQHR